ncbi:hypothetical protein EG329_005109 [Mollisiaceae sp. DMI_Dod_QoI]|nr:hypothetical protein EG329_005109 [Helotiales sp. DMI_Dod_QoI]
MFSSSDRGKGQCPEPYEAFPVSGFKDQTSVHPIFALQVRGTVELHVTAPYVALVTSFMFILSFADGTPAENKLETLKRKPSNLRRYMAWSVDIKAQYGSMTNYLIQHRLPWGSPPFTYTSPIPFEDPSDYKVLLNDWPYGLTPDVTHIVVWSKTPIATDGTRGDVTDESRKVIEGFVERAFVKRLGDANRVMWFKNWVSLQSVRALEHVHVLVKDATKEDLEFWTGKKL